ncbi:aminoglycoside phosphotransferase family protein [Saccharibacillus sp. JS10]|uniref:aminoglycoside phosphotransferase family protein n=1 Tax=Saccharibacillus sp. JS10 TaxID=2950552 RepID=UPI00210CCF08|nr:aminoglycoside phosphotransferase family protein [Saccharibacillus sp. JS10]MCQ4088451.1 aminoglycoside phosphotransferase family protein [Saccharibacillus sp. JS10]
MSNLIRDIIWMEGNEAIAALSDIKVVLAVESLESGLEAEVHKIKLSDSSFVLKIWNRTSKPNVELQYKLLKELYFRGLSVSRPLGWGLDKEMNSVLLTSFDGVPIMRVNKPTITTLSKILSEIHRLPIEEIDSSLLRRHEFFSYFYPSIEEHHDIKKILRELVKLCDMKQDRIIHGDFNLGNVLLDDGKYTVIDWTNFQLGDPRYDIAWSVSLMKIYASERWGSIYLQSFLSKNKYTFEEMELYEAIASLRWVLLNRIDDLPKEKDTINRVRNILKNNKYINESLL